MEAASHKQGETMVTTDSEDYQFSAAAPLAASGLDIDGLLSGDPATLAQAKSMGLPLPTGPSPSGGANPAVGSNASSPAGTAAMQPQAQPSKPPNAIMPSGKPATVPSSMDGMGAALAQSHQGPSPSDRQTALSRVLTAPPLPSPGAAPTDFGANLAQSAPAATNAPNPPSEASHTPAVPAAVTPSGTAEDPNQQGIQRAGEMAESFSQKLAAQPTLAEELAPIQAKRTLPPQEFDPAHPEYRPTAGRRILRGLAAVGEGVARGGIRGGLLGGLDPEAVGATPYSAPTRQFSIAAQQQQAQQAALDKQQTMTTEAYKEDTGRAKDVITSINDIGKNYAAGETAQSRVDVAQARKESADVQQQLADLRQQVQDTLNQGKMPTTYEQAVIASKLEKDPKKAQAYAQAAREMAETEVRKFQFANGNQPDKSAFRQSMIDAATAQVQALQDKYEYNPRRNQYVNKSKPNDVLDPSEFTDRKNEISTKLDSQLEAKKMPKLGVRFDPADAGASKPSGRAARQQGQQATNKPKPPTPTAPAPQGAVDMALGTDNQYHYRDAGKKDLGFVK